MVGPRDRIGLLTPGLSAARTDVRRCPQKSPFVPSTPRWSAMTNPRSAGTVLLPRDNLNGWFAILEALAQRAFGVAESHHRQDLKLRRQVHQVAHRLEFAKPCPVRPDALTPRGEDHRLNRAACIGDSEVRLLFICDHNGHGSLGDVRACAHELS